MQSPQYILALDQGTSSSRALLFDENGRVVKKGQRSLVSRYPLPGWVEQDPEEIWSSQWSAVQDCLDGVDRAAILALGIANQRETIILFERATGKPVYPAISWQCRRTFKDCTDLKAQGAGPMVRDKTGLPLDAYFSATKIAWILDAVPGLRRRAEHGEIAVATVDSWLVYKLTGGRQHVTDASNAARTSLFNIHTLLWDQDLLGLFRVPGAVLPTIVDSSGRLAYTEASLLGRSVPITGLAGDQQAALFGHRAFERGMAKNTYGTGAFLLMNTGDRPVTSSHGLLTTVAWRVAHEPIQYALEGSVFSAGSAIQWLRHQLHIIEPHDDIDALARSVQDTGDVYFVPAFSGTGAPSWDANARGTIVGLTQATNRSHLIRAALESIAFQTRDVLDAMRSDANIDVKTLPVDGGVTRNRFLMSFQADILNLPVVRLSLEEATALGAAFLAGSGVGLWEKGHFPAIEGELETFWPSMEDNRRNGLYQRWQLALNKAGGWTQ